jgi:replication initiation and membrane attachment protein DnaB
VTVEEYLDSVLAEKLINNTVHDLALMVWDSIRVYSKAYNPNVDVNADGGIAFSWDRDEHHFEMEVFESGLVECFYLNHITNETDEYETYIKEGIL